jgi:hypothetical protein
LGESTKTLHKPFLAELLFESSLVHLKRTYPEPHSTISLVNIFLVMLRFEQQDKLAELRGDLLETGQNDFV